MLLKPSCSIQLEFFRAPQLKAVVRRQTEIAVASIRRASVLPALRRTREWGYNSLHSISVAGLSRIEPLAV